MNLSSAESLISFFLQFELGWKVLKELLRYEGKSVSGTGSPRAIIKAAYEVYDFIDEHTWLLMLRVRNDMSYLYNGSEALKIVDEILNVFIPEFEKVKSEIRRRYENILNEL